MEPPVLPAFPLANPPEIPTARLELPAVNLPSYTPMVYPYGGASDVAVPKVEDSESEAPAEKPKTPAIKPVALPPIATPPQQVLGQTLQKESATPTEVLAQPVSAETTTITLPGTEIQVPIPRAEIMSAAATTSAISVAATLSATAAFKRLVTIFKPIINVAVKRVQKLRGKPVVSWGRQRLGRHRRKQPQIEIQVQK